MEKAIEKLRQGLDLDSIRVYLRGLSPEQQTKLLRHIEAGAFNDHDIATVKAIEQQLRQWLRDSGYHRDRIANPARTLFEPIRPFLVDDVADSTKGQISRKSLKAIWAWLSRDLMPDATKLFSSGIKEAAESNNLSMRESLAREFRARVVRICEMAIESQQGRSAAHNRLTHWGGPPGTLDTLLRVIRMLKEHEARSNVA